MDMTPEEQAAADAAAAAAKAAQDTVSRAELLKVIAERDSAKAKAKELAELADVGKKALDATKSAEERLASLQAERDALKTQAEEATTAMQARLAQEIESIPEAMRSLVPDGLSPAKKLEWIGNALKAGIFGQQKRGASPGAEFGSGGGGSTMTQTEFSNKSFEEKERIRELRRQGKITIVPG